MAVVWDRDEREMQRQLTTSSHCRLAARLSGVSAYETDRTY